MGKERQMTNELTKPELKRFSEIRRQMTKFYASRDLNDYHTARRMARDWLKADRRRRIVRQAACNTVKFLYSELHESEVGCPELD